MSTAIDCPICMDCIETTSKNCVTTECGHCFHTNCLMQSVAHNGFGCPYCRTAMAEVPDEEETIYSDEQDEYDDDDEEEEMFDDDALRGFRFFWNILNGEEHDVDDEDEEEVYIEELTDFPHTQSSNASNIPSSNFIAQKLKEQGVTFEQLISATLMNHVEYHTNEENDRTDGEIFGMIRRIINNYTPTLEQAEPLVVAAVPAVDFEAQPKTVQVRSITRIDLHV